MRASVSVALTEARQEVDLAVILIPGAAFLALGCLALRAVLIFFWDAYLGGCVWFDALRTCGFVQFDLLFACFFFRTTISS